MRRGPKPAKSKGESKPPVARKSPKDDGSRVRDLATLEKRLAEAEQREAEALKREAEALKLQAEAQEQQTATADILRVISSSPTDVQPVFDAIVESAARLCDAVYSALTTFDGELMDIVAAHNWTQAAWDAARRTWPARPNRALASGRAILDRAVVHLPDVELDREYDSPEMSRTVGFRSILAVPMMRDDKPIGVILVGRAEPGRFSDTQIALLKTFADQAVIAIENVRLFNETKEALERQTATSEILRVIAGSPTEIQPVLDTIAENAARVCGASDAIIYRVDGDGMRRVAQFGALPMHMPEVVSLSRSFPTARSIIDRQTIHIDDLQTVLDTEYTGIKAVRTAPSGIRGGIRTLLATPLIREGVPIGAILIRRLEVRPFSDRQIALLQTFADQAVIAIENVRLFQELQEKNAALTAAHTQVTQSLEQQTATSEILRVIASSPTDVQPVFDAIVANAARLCHGNFGAVHRYDGEFLHLVAHYNIAGEALEYLRQLSPRPPGTAVRERRVVLIADFETDPEVPEAVRIGARLRGSRSNVTVPMLRDNSCLGVIVVGKREPGLFPDEQVQLLQTFADQAVIAIENVRLFTELQEKNGALTLAHAQTSEALEQQTATSEILRVISSSPTDIQPVLDTVAESAARLCEAQDAGIFRRDSNRLLLVAHYGPIAGGRIGEFSLPLNRGTPPGRSVLDGQSIHVADLQAGADEFPEGSELARRMGFRTALTVPLMREGAAIGSITLRRVEARLFTERQIALLQTFADQAVIAIENVRLFNETKEALEQQTATSEILRVISRSPTDLQPVFDAIAESAVRLCGGVQGNVVRFDGELVHRVAGFNLDPEGEEALRQYFPRAVGRELAITRAILDGSVVHLPDTLQDADHSREITQATRARAILAVPMLRDGQPIGAISVVRREARPFSDSQIALLTTFADQAVIAIENVRLFSETREALERQTATSEILRVISSSPTDTQPVFDIIAANAARLCTARDAQVLRVEGDVLRLVSAYGSPSMPPVRTISRGHGVGRAVIDRQTIHVRDMAQAIAEYPETSAPQHGVESILAVPLLREGVAVGVIRVSRTQRQPFTEQQITLLETFADQAVIAIENVRLFSELQSSNRELTTALDTQTATSDILRVISRSQTNVQPVFDAILASAVRLLGAYSGGLTRVAADQINLVALTSTDAAGDATLRANFPQSLQSEGPHPLAIRDRMPLNIADAHTDPRLFEAQHVNARIRGYRSQVVVPMLHHNEAVGTISVTRREPGGFTDDEIALLQTFADQAVIAIENVRLFTELQARTHDLTRSVGQLTALAEVGRAVSSTLDLETVLSTIVSRAIQLSGTDGGSVYEYDEATEEFSLRASRDLPEAYVEQVRDTRPRKGEGAVGRVAQTREPVQITDISDPAAYESRVRNILLQIGLRALLAVPLIAEDHLVGALIVMRKRTGTFAAEEVALLQTFATQSALAIQNARLFREIEEKSRQLEVASQHKSEFLANMSHELRTPLNAIIGFSEVLSERMFGELNEKQEEYSKDIHASGQHLLSLINDILDLSKIEAGRMELELTDFHLPTALDNALTLVRERAGRRGIALQMNVDSRLGQVQADERKIRQVVLNLLSNAIKFTPEGGRIEVGAAPKDGLVEVSVSDTGVGIAPEDQEAVFEEFRQVGTADKKVEGTGLGLTLCRKFVELHGGTIWVKSELGAGSTFTFTLPLRDPD